MRRSFIVIVLIFLLPLYSCSDSRPGAASAEVQPAVQKKADFQPIALPFSVAGSFYPADPAKLKGDINSYLQAASVPEIDGEIVAAIVPHAGYVYSAPVAAYAYKAIAANLEQRKKKGAAQPDAIFILGFNHKASYPFVSVLPKGAMETPLGLAPVNDTIAQKFMSSSRSFSFAEQAFIGEHSAEVQIPFIQVLFPDIPVVPVIFGQQSAANIEAVGAGMEAAAKDSHILLIATTDLSHYNPYEKAVELDKETINVLLDGSPRKAAAFISEHYDRLCGPGPVLAALSFAESQNAAPMLLNYANSGDTSGQKNAVVGYAAIVFVRKTATAPHAAEGKLAPSVEVGESDYLSNEDKKLLLTIARNAIESYVREKKIYEPEAPSDKRLAENGAAFVTLSKNGNLRGCIGSMQATTPLYLAVAQMAVAAASQDPRFPSVQAEELKDIHVEISVNTPLRPVSGPDEIVLGKHGVVVTKGLRQGVFLPQVATETGWSKEEFLRQLCFQKAGLPPDAYKNGAHLSVFTSIVFGEEK